MFQIKINKLPYGEARDVGIGLNGMSSRSFGPTVFIFVHVSFQHDLGQTDIIFQHILKINSRFDMACSLIVLVIRRAIC